MLTAGARIPGHPPPRRVIAVGGGKGGVGKTVVAANLAVALAQRGRCVTLVDADFGAANLHTLFGIDRPGPGLGGLLSGHARTVAEVLCRTSVPGVTLLPGLGAVPGSANFNHGQKQKLLAAVRAAGGDVVVIDVGAGIAFNTLDFFLLADQQLVVLTPQMTSIQNAYAFLKAALHRHVERSVLQVHAMTLADEARAPAVEPVAVWLARTSREDPAAAARARAALGRLAVRVVGNNVFHDKDRAVVHSVCRMFRDYLGAPVDVLGVLRASRRVHDSINHRRPFLLEDAMDDNSRAFHSMAEALLSLDAEELRPAADGEGAHQEEPDENAAPRPGGSQAPAPGAAG
ncbi:MAG: P-loop NTPase [Deltaproteobacteria bacterium]|nr:P-loop NTPase [Deltaproteobacteria bacterium]